MNQTSKINYSIPNVTQDQHNAIDLTMGLSDNIKDHSAGIFHRNEFIDVINDKEFINTNFICFKPERQQCSSKFFPGHKGSKKVSKKNTSVAKYTKKQSFKAKNYENGSKSTMVQTKMFAFICYGVNVGEI